VDKTIKTKSMQDKRKKATVSHREDHWYWGKQRDKKRVAKKLEALVKKKGYYTEKKKKRLFLDPCPGEKRARPPRKRKRQVLLKKSLP